MIAFEYAIMEPEFNWRKHGSDGSADGAIASIASAFASVRSHQSEGPSNSVLSNSADALFNDNIEVLAEKAFTEATSLKDHTYVACYSVLQFISRHVANPDIDLKILDCICCGLMTLDCPQCWRRIIKEASRDEIVHNCTVAHCRDNEPMCVCCAISFYGFRHIDDAFLNGAHIPPNMLRMAFIGAFHAVDHEYTLRIYIEYILANRTVHPMIIKACVRQLFKLAVSAICHNRTTISEICKFLAHCYFPSYVATQDAQIMVDGEDAWQKIKFRDIFENEDRQDILKYIENDGAHWTHIGPWTQSFEDLC